MKQEGHMKLPPESFTFFWGERHPLSHWHPSPFTVKDVRFSCVEQFFMYCKARLFSDTVVADKILEASHPREHKRLGRLVSGFDQARWDVMAMTYMRLGNREKFAQNPGPLAVLLRSAGTVIVEASPSDKLWGAGLAADDPRILDPGLWPGRNLAGKNLMDLRDNHFLKQAGHFLRQDPRETQARHPSP
jgi:hypothetical protein